MLFIVKSHSSVTPRFLTESDKGIDALHIVIESGNEGNRHIDLPSEDTIITSVLASLNLTYFHRHPCFDVISTPLQGQDEIWDLMRTGAAYSWSKVSSVYGW